MTLYVVTWRFEECGTVHATKALTKGAADIVADELTKTDAVDICIREATPDESAEWYEAAERLA